MHIWREEVYWLHRGLRREATISTHPPRLIVAVLIVAWYKQKTGSVQPIMNLVSFKINGPQNHSFENNSVHFKIDHAKYS